MQIPILAILLCCTVSCLASHESHSQSHTIPIEGYATKLENLGQHVEIPETPVKVIKITKTIAVKVPVPYPVKVIEKVPYPVHVAKPYPVPVPQIVKVPYAKPAKHGHGHEALDVQPAPHHAEEPRGYQVQEGHSSGGDEHSFVPYEGSNSGYQNFGIEAEGGSESAYEAPSNYYGNSAADDSNSFESKSYDQALKDYFAKQNTGGSHSNPGSQYYH